MVRFAAAHAVAPAPVERVLAARSATKRAQEWMADAIRLADDGGAHKTRKEQRTRAVPQDRLPRRLQQGPPGEHTAVRATSQGWRCDACYRTVKYSRGWRVWQQIPCRKMQRRRMPKEGPSARAAEAPAGAQPHDLVSAGGRTWCTGCGRSSLTRWRAKLGAWCARPPDAADVPVPPVPVAPRPARAPRAEVQARLDTHLLVDVGGFLCCQRPGCGRRVRPRERARLGVCRGEDGEA